ncbi:MAG: SpoIIE family protein phosphatase [Sedimentisphaerales bacterium]|nr:SpoIIE family protein phosphatase [Sedimentisphaerales bacterium]
MPDIDHNHLDDENASPAAEAVVQAAARLDRKVRQLNRDLSSVRETSRLLTAPLDLAQVLEIVVKTVAQAIGADAAGLRLLEQETGELVLKATWGLSPEYIKKGPVTAGESTLNTRALRGEAIVVNDMRTDPHFQRYRTEIAREGLVSNLTLGLTYKDKGIGTLRIYQKRRRRFSPSDISIAQTVAAQSAAAIINARLYKETLEADRMARQLHLAGDVQRHLIPRTAPAIPGLDLAGHYVPCYDVGGDFYDYIPLPNGHLVVAIGDVMGKGVPASLAMASLRSSLRAYAELIDSICHCDAPPLEIRPNESMPEAGSDARFTFTEPETQLNELVRRVNQMFCRDITFGDFATLFCARISPDRRRLTYCNCGHEPPILLRDDRAIDLAEGGIVIGVDKDSRYRSRTIELKPQDMIVMYTDGLADAANFRQEYFGRDRIIAAARESRGLTADQAAKNILWLMRKFTGLTRRGDDTALVVLKRTE